MRTTVTLDSDVESLIRNIMKEQGLSFREALHCAIRAGAKQTKRRPFVQNTFSLGAKQSFRWDKALATAEAMEDEELTRKLSLLNPLN